RSKILTSPCGFVATSPRGLVSPEHRVRRRILSKLDRTCAHNLPNTRSIFSSAFARLAPSSGNSRKEVIQPQVLLQLPCYDFTPITDHTLGTCLLAVSTATSSTTSFHAVTGGVYKARERIHCGMLIRDY